MSTMRRSCFSYNPEKLGCFAHEFIPRHTLLITEVPSLCGANMESAMTSHENGYHACQEDDDVFLRDVVGLDDEERARIWAMHDQFSPTEKRLHGIVKSNAYVSSDVSCDESGLGLYVEMGRFNHSCAPNVGYGFDGWQMRMYTTRDIQAGEELVTCYSDMVYFHRVEARQIFLKAKFNFDCICKGCSANSHNSKSDANRERLRFLVQMLSSQGASSVKCGHLQMIVESINIMKEESLEHNLFSTYKIAYEWAEKLGEEGKEIVKDLNISNEAMKILELSKGESHPETVGFRDLLTKL